MEILGIIPVRGGSKRLPRKNLALIDGQTLLSRTIQQAQASRYLTRLVVCTEDDELAQEAARQGVQVIKEPVTLAEGPTVFALQFVLNHLEKYENYHPLIAVTLQVTSPLRTPADIDQTIKLVIDGARSAETLCEGKENGAVYVSTRYMLLYEGKIVDNPAIHEMPRERSVDVDTQEDLDKAIGGVKPEAPRKRGRPKRK